MNTRKLLVSVLMLVSILFSACASTTATPPAPTDVPPTSIPPTVASTVAPAQAQTTFSPKTFDVPITFSYGSDWKIDSEISSEVVLKYKNYDGEFLFINPKSAKVVGPAAPYSVIPFPDDFVNWIQAHGLFQIVKTQSVVVGGLSGTQIDADATPACGSKTTWFLVGAGGWNCGSGGHYRFIYLDDVNGERLLVMTVGYISAQDFVLMTDASQKVLETVAFSKPTTFSSSKLEIPMTLTYGSDWYSEGEFPDLFTLKIKGTGYAWELGFHLVNHAQIADPNSSATMPWPDDFVAYLQSNHYFEAGQPMPVTVGGVKGIQIDALVKNIGQKRTFIAMKSTDWLYLDDTEMYRFIMLDDNNGQRLLITMNAPPDGFSKATELEQKVLDTVVFSQPTVFSSKTFNLPITFSYGPEWSVAEEYSDEFLLNYAGHDAGVAFINVKNAKIADGLAFPDDFGAWIQSSDSLFQVVDSKPVLVGGFNGIQINAIAACGSKANWITLSGTGWKCPNGEHIGFIYLSDVHGESPLIQIQGSPDGEDYMFIVEESQKVLDTVVFTQPATFLPKTFKLITSVNFGSGWHVEEDYLHDLYLDNGQMPIVFNIVTTAQLVDPVGGILMPFPDDFMSWIQSDPDFKTGEPTQVTVGGISGMQVDATPNTNISKKEFGLTWNILTSDGDWRFILLDNVNGEHVLILMIAPAGKTFSELPELQQEIQHILDSVVFA